MRRAPFPASAPLQHPEARAQASPSHALSLLRRRLDAPREACCAALAGACWLRARPPADRARHRRPNRPPTPTAAPAATLTAPGSTSAAPAGACAAAPADSWTPPRAFANVRAPFACRHLDCTSQHLRRPCRRLRGSACGPLESAARPPNVRTPFESRHWEPTHNRTRWRLRWRLR